MIILEVFKKGVFQIIGLILTILMIFDEFLQKGIKFFKRIFSAGNGVFAS